MDFLSSNTALMLQKSIDFLWTKQSCLLDNIANAETPGYQPKYATFEESLHQAIQAASGQSGSAEKIRSAIEDTPVQVHQAQESTRLDGNGVNVTEQMVELVRNGYQMQYVMDAISSDFSLLRTAIRG
ncbi:flagellar basal body rod protein FlgB [Lawsonibacter sp. LCP25S3_G6]|uniref:flagellar basal body rod protein FlgB n=1 Tax=unclassified Lawsonibacter TaxID=2617946 RepID=UPI003F9B67C4